MSDPAALMGFGQVMGGIGQAGAGAANTALSFAQLQQNMQMFQQSRKDAANAVQIRARDMAAAGINPLLAAGSPAQTMAAPQLDAPRLDPAIFEGVSQAFSAPMNAMRQSADLGNKLAQNELMVAQADKTTAEADFLKGTMPNRMKSVDLDTQYKALTLPDRVASVTASLTGKEFDNANKSMDYLIKDLGLDATRLDMEYKRALLKIAGNTAALQGQQLDYNKATLPNEIMAKGIAVRQLAQDDVILQSIRQKLNPTEVGVLQTLLGLSGQVIKQAGDLAGSFRGR